MSEARSPRAPWVEQALGRGSRVELPARDGCVQGRPAEAEQGVVKRSLPWSCRAEPRLLAASTQRKPRSLPGTHAVRVHAVSFGWQKSIERISRLGRRRVARLRGGLRALAGRMLVASSDARHARRDGEAVRGWESRPSRSGIPARSAGLGSRIHDTTEGALGPHLRHLTVPGGHRGPTARRSIHARGFPERDHHRTRGKRIGRRGGRSGVPGSDHESVRGRHGLVKAPRGPRRSERGPHPRR